MRHTRQARRPVGTMSFRPTRRRRDADVTARALVRRPLGPRSFPRVPRPEDRPEQLRGIVGARDHVDSSGQPQRLRERAIARIAAAEAERPAPGQTAQPQVGNPRPGQKVERLERPSEGEGLRASRPGKGPVLSPLHVDEDLPLRPGNVEDIPMPVRPKVNRSPGRVVAHPDDFLVRGPRKGHPGAVGVVAPQEMIGDDRPGRVENRHRPNQREPFIGLQV